MSGIRVVIADDHTLMRSGLKLMLSSQQDIKVIGEASDGREALELVSNLRPDIVLMDISMPGMSGIECLQQIATSVPETKVILLTMYEDSQYLKQGLAAGAVGYVLKKAADDVLFQAIRTVQSGAVFFPAAMSKALSRQEKPAAKSEGPTKPLSEKEKTVLSYIAMGYSNAEIADKLYISVKTVETYKYRIMEKLNAKKRSDLVKYALEQGLASGD